MHCDFPKLTGQRAFTLVEVMVSIAITGLLVVVLASVLNQTMKTWTLTRGRTEQFREARNAFERITRNLSQAVLYPYWDYADQSGNFRTSANAQSFQPYQYVRRSELRFICGPGLVGNASSSPARPTHAVFFQAPLGYVDDTSDFGDLQNLLNTCGYFIQYDDASSSRPGFFKRLAHAPALRYRFRLMEMMQPSENMTLYSLTAANPSYSGHDWFSTALSGSQSLTHVVAENIVALVIMPKISSTNTTVSEEFAPNYTYDSTDKTTASGLQFNQLPPLLQVTMVAVDEASFARLGNTETAPELVPDSLFQTVSQYDADLKTLISTLRERKLNYRVFTADVVLKAAKWTPLE